MPGLLGILRGFVNFRTSHSSKQTQSNGNDDVHSSIRDLPDQTNSFFATPITAKTCEDTQEVHRQGPGATAGGKGSRASQATKTQGQHVTGNEEALEGRVHWVWWIPKQSSTHKLLFGHQRDRGRAGASFQADWGYLRVC
ncbi:hypothetical protein WJX84_009897 [Apatococcus fuscideae]|uniref:Uncharacterized protein n=1 Tax=Apatococcus fuscideae TaxID=2026836 RepID=A0AAW1SUH5_9CHLO